MRRQDEDGFWFEDGTPKPELFTAPLWRDTPVKQNANGSWSPVIERLKIDFDLRLTPADKQFLKDCGISLTKDTRCGTVVL